LGFPKVPAVEGIAGTLNFGGHVPGQ
jgi:hypothetical protein